MKEQKEKDQAEAKETAKSPAAVEEVVLNGDILSNGTDISQATSGNYICLILTSSREI